MIDPKFKFKLTKQQDARMDRATKVHASLFALYVELKTEAETNEMNRRMIDAAMCFDDHGGTSAAEFLDDAHMKRIYRVAHELLFDIDDERVRRTLTDVPTPEEVDLK